MSKPLTILISAIILIASFNVSTVSAANESNREVLCAELKANLEVTYSSYNHFCTELSEEESDHDDSYISIDYAPTGSEVDSDDDDE